LKKEELVRILQAIRDVEQNEKGRLIYLTVVVSNMRQKDVQEVLDQIKPEVKDYRNWFKLPEPSTPVV